MYCIERSQKVVYNDLLTYVIINNFPILSGNHLKLENKPPTHG